MAHVELERQYFFPALCQKLGLYILKWFVISKVTILTLFSSFFGRLIIMDALIVLTFSWLV